MDVSAVRLRQLNAQREALEIESMAISSELNSPGINGEPSAGVKSPLVDAEGYPRSDIDIMNVRSKRNRLAIINTDHMALMKDIEKELANYHSSAGNADGGGLVSGSSVFNASGSGGSSSSSSSSSNRSYISFALIDEILPDSPAAAAGIGSFCPVALIAGKHS